MDHALNLTGLLKMRYALILFLILTLSGPLWILFTAKINFKADYRTANREPSHLAADPSKYHDAIIQVYGARAFSWRGIFALHLWISVKPKNASSYTIYQVLGWNAFRGMPALSITQDFPDRYWFNQKPFIIFDARGQFAENIIIKLEALVKNYPYQHEYRTWPGPNSNTFVAYVGRNIPEMQLTLPSNALGKDFTGWAFFEKAPSNTGYQVSLFGIIGVLIAKQEGIELNLFGLVYGINVRKKELKLPGFGNFSCKL